METYSDYDAVGLAELVRKGEVTPAELTDAAITRIEKLNPTLNAVVIERFDEARAAAADLPDGPLKGVPFALKDLSITVAGWPRTSGSRFCKDVVDGADSGLTTRYRASGVNLLGRTATSEFGIVGVTETALYGPTRNPWNPDHTPGGSSGGAAAAVASGMLPMAHAMDGLGSIRIPAACCGLGGLKTTRDRVPDLPDGFDYAMGFDVGHVVSRTVRDTALMLDLTGLPEPGAPYAPPPKTRPYMEEITRAPGRLKIAWSSAKRPIDPEIQSVLEETAAVLEKLGHDVRPQTLETNYAALYAARGPFSGANFAAGIKRYIAKVGREPEEADFERFTWSCLHGGRRVSGEDAAWSLQELRMLNYGVVRFFEDWDVYLTPVMGQLPPKIGYIDSSTMSSREINARQSEVFPYTPPFNFAGLPSISLPLGWSKSGLPIGMMFSAAYADEATLLRLAAQLEKEMPWKDRRPPIWA
ncbi:MAG: amidase family protein [Caulobacteraceae bacterium]